MIEILPQIILYIVTGFAFIKTYHFVALRQNTMDLEHILTASLVIGYIYTNIAYMIPASTYDWLVGREWIDNAYIGDNILIILSAVICGFLSARILRSKSIQWLLAKLKIRESGNVYLWDDLLDNEYPMKAILTCGNLIYEGMVHMYESYSNEPHVVLSAYLIRDVAACRTLEDFSNDSTKVIIIDTAKADTISIVYYEDEGKNSICQSLKELCDFKKSFEEQEEQDT